jgi:hypothetical protein
LIKFEEGGEMDQDQRVVVVDVDMKFMTMVFFLVKLAIASIPAAIILVTIGLLAFAFLSGLVAGL